MKEPYKVSLFSLGILFMIFLGITGVIAYNVDKYDVFSEKSDDDELTAYDYNIINNSEEILALQADETVEEELYIEEDLEEEEDVAVDEVDEIYEE